jgi:hypothetical protein
MENKLIIIAYCIYLPIALGLTYYVAKTLFKNAKVFMLDIFHGKEDIAFATNRLFEIGFYLMNLGFALLILKIRVSQYNPFETYQKLMETLSYKIGWFSIYLGVMLFLNLLMFFRGRRKSKQSEQQKFVKPVAPAAPQQ